MKKQIATTTAPAAIGPYSQAIHKGNLLFVSGQIPLNPSTNQLVEGGIKDQTRQVFKNIGEILKEANTTYENIVKITVFLTDLTHFPQVNEVFQEFLQEPYPARSTIQVAGLPKSAKIEIEAIALTS